MSEKPHRSSSQRRSPISHRPSAPSVRASSSIPLPPKSFRDQFRLIEHQINSAGIHEWAFDVSCPLDVVFLTEDGRHHVSMNRHRYFEIVYVCSGPAECRAGTRCLMASAGDLLVIGSDLRHSIIGPSSPITLAALFFEPELICDGSCDGPEYLTPFLFQDSEFPHIVRASTGVPSQVLNFMLRIHAELPATSLLSRLTVKTYLKMALILLVNHFASCGRTWETLQNQQRALEHLHPVFHFLRDNCEKKILVGEAARISGMSESHFMNLFKKATGLSFVKYLNHYRVERAQAELAISDEPLSSICQKLGFCDQSYFGRVFRELVGSTPASYRRHCQKANDSITRDTSLENLGRMRALSISWKPTPRLLEQ